MPCAPRSQLSLRTRRRPRPGTPRSGRAGWAGRHLRKRREWRFPTEPCCSSPALSKRSETPRLWLGTALPRASHKNRTSCGRRIKPGVWPARWTRRSNSPWVVPAKRRKPWPAPCRALFDECATGNRLPCTTTGPSANIPSPAGSRTTRGSGHIQTLSGLVYVDRTTAVDATQEVDMQFAALIYQDWSWIDGLGNNAMSETEAAEIGKQYAEIAATPGFQQNIPLGHPRDAATVRVQDGETIASDGTVSGL